MTRWYLNVCWLTLVMIAVPFMVSQVRMGIFPQLEYPWQTIQATSRAESPMPAPASMSMEAMDAAQQQLGKMAKRAPGKKNEYDSDMAEEKVSDAYYGSSVATLERIDPKAKVQTGPGLPQWQWTKVYLSWNGSVDSGQQLGLWYLSPGMTMVLNFLRVALIAMLTLLMFGVAEKFMPQFISKLGHGKVATPLLLWFIVLPLLSIPSPKVYADYPSEALLNELKTRLQEVEIPDCLPACAQIQQMNVVITDKTIAISLQIDAQESVTLPLPSEYNQWFPNQVLDNGEPAQALYRDNNTLWINLKKGEHKVILKGLTPYLSKFTLPLPLKPNRVTVEKSGWEVVGLNENGWSDGQLQFSRIQQTRQDKTRPVLEPGVLTPFVRVSACCPSAWIGAL